MSITAQNYCLYIIYALNNKFMYVYNFQDIGDYLREQAAHHRLLSPLLKSAMTTPITHDFRFLSAITHETDIDEYSARKAFRKANRYKNGAKNPIIVDKDGVRLKEIDVDHLYNTDSHHTHLWFRFRPNPALDAICGETIGYLRAFVLAVQPKHFTGMVPITARKKLEGINSIAELSELIKSGQYPLSHDEIEAAKNTRLVPDEEKKNLVRHIGNLSDRCFLLQITTIRGMKNAGQKAENCLGWRRLPDGREPHKTRVLKPDRWLYFSVRDADNESLITFGVDVRRGKIIYEGNQSQPVSDRHHHLIEEALDLIHQAHPQINDNARQYRPYGIYNHHRL